jgi:hypothetical protein
VSWLRGGQSLHVRLLVPSASYDSSFRCEGSHAGAVSFYFDMGPAVRTRREPLYLSSALHPCGGVGARLPFPSFSNFFSFLKLFFGFYFFIQFLPLPPFDMALSSDLSRVTCRVGSCHGCSVQFRVSSRAGGHALRHSTPSLCSPYLATIFPAHYVKITSTARIVLYRSSYTAHVILGCGTY